MNWYKKAQIKERIINAKAQIMTIDDLPTIEEDEDKETERARKYFNIGHGEDVEEFGYAPDFQLWIMLDGEIMKSKILTVDPITGETPDEKTHRTLWGNLEDTNYKGRYEPQTGRLTIVKPNFARFRDIPNEIINRIQRAFPKAKKFIVAANNKQYKISQNLQSLTQIATQFRKQMIKCYDDECLRSLCLPVSRKLKEYLISKGYDAIVVQGVFTVDNPDPEATQEWDINDFESQEEMEDATYHPLHYWVEIRDLIIDITADQFNDELDEPVPPINIGTYQELERYKAIHKDWI